MDLKSSHSFQYVCSILIRCRPGGICRDAAFRMMERKI